MKQTILELTLLDTIFMVIAVFSLFANLFQFMIYWRDRKNLHRPIHSSLVGLFNDIKSKVNHAFLTQNLLFSQINPHRDVQTMRWEYAAFTHTVINYLQGLQETVVAILVTIDPSDKDGKAAFRATEYGLTEEDKRARRQFMEQYAEQQSAQKQDDQEVVRSGASGTDSEKLQEQGTQEPRLSETEAET